MTNKEYVDEGAHAMTWTIDRPAEPGWYWMKDHDGQVQMVEVSDSMQASVMMGQGGVTAEVSSPLFTNMQWAGPLRPPE